MTIKNKYVKNSKISEAKFREILRYFALDLEANKIAILTNISRNTINKYLLKIRERIAEYCCNASHLSGIIEVDESFLEQKESKGSKGEEHLAK